ncbi:MAG: hypothetical protein ACE5O2_04345 [Armatimonadota bacterium]
MACANIMIVGGGTRELSALGKSMGDIFVAPPLRAAGAPEDNGPRPIQFARISVSDDLALHLYLIAGDRKFSFIWGVLARDMSAYVLLVNGETPQGIAAASQVLEVVASASRAPYVVAVTDEQRDLAAHQSAVAQELGLPPQCPVLPCDCADRDSVKRVLYALLQELMQTMQAAAPTRARETVATPAAV